MDLRNAVRKRNEIYIGTLTTPEKLCIQPSSILFYPCMMSPKQALYKAVEYLQYPN